VHARGERCPAVWYSAGPDGWRLSLSRALHGLNPALGGSDGPQVRHSGPLRHRDIALEPWRQRPDWPALAARLHEDEAQRVAGAALAGDLFRAVLPRGIEGRTECRVDHLVVDNGRVLGLTFMQLGTVQRIRASRGVVLATGGGDGPNLAREQPGERHRQPRSWQRHPSELWVVVLHHVPYWKVCRPEMFRNQLRTSGPTCGTAIHLSRTTTPFF
jgi:FAD binding domain